MSVEPSKVTRRRRRRSRMDYSFSDVQRIIIILSLLIFTTLIITTTEGTTDIHHSTKTTTEQEESTTPNNNNNKKKRKFRFALCPKSIDNIFFDVSRDGCYDRARQLSSSQQQDNSIENLSETQEIECLYIGPTEFNPDGIEQASIIRQLIYNHTTQQGHAAAKIDGLAISVTNPNEMRPVISEALEKQIPVVTFDSDDILSGRASYIGTDNYFFGKQLGKVLQQLNPGGGKFAIITDSTPNIILREQGVRQSLLGHDDKRVLLEKKEDGNNNDDDDDGNNKEKEKNNFSLWWEESISSPIDMKGNNTLAIELMDELLSKDKSITAVIPVMGGPMFLPDLWVNLVDKYPDVAFVVGDGLSIQLDFLSKGKVSGLVAQLPYSMGSISIDSLLKLATTSSDNEAINNNNNNNNILPDFQGTNVLEHVTVPLVLPPLTVNQNHLGHLSMLGFTLFAIILTVALIFMVWTIINQNRRVVRLAQPLFLIQIVVGSIIMGAAIIPLSFDDSSPNYTNRKGQFMCMAVPWLAFLGFTIIYSALVAKLWRVNQISRSGTYHNVVISQPTRSRHSRSSRNSSSLYYNNGGGYGGGGGGTTTSSGTPPSSGFQRVKLRYRDVLIPLGLLLTANVVTLLTWTLLDPLQYTRVNAEGTDPWNRVLATYGTCTMDQPWPYLAVLGLLNVGVLIFATIQAYKARDVKVSEIADESKYVAMAVASMLHVSLVGMPLLAVVRDDPQAWYLTVVFLLFVVCFVVLVVVFVPKMIFAATTNKVDSTLSTPRQNNHNRIPASVVQSPPTPQQTGSQQQQQQQQHQQQQQQQRQESSLLSSVSEEDESTVDTPSSSTTSLSLNKCISDDKDRCSQQQRNDKTSSRGISYSVALESIPEELCPSSSNDTTRTTTTWVPKRIQAVSSLGNSETSDIEQQPSSQQKLEDIMQSQNTDNALPPCVPTRRKTWLDENGEAHTSSEFHVVDDNNNNKSDGEGDHYAELLNSSSNGNCPRRQGEQSAMESSLDGSRDMMPFKPLPKTSFSIMSVGSSDSFATFGVEDQETALAATSSDADTAIPTSASIAAHHMAAW